MVSAWLGCLLHNSESCSCGCGSCCSCSCGWCCCSCCSCSADHNIVVQGTANVGNIICKPTGKLGEELYFFFRYLILQKLLDARTLCNLQTSAGGMAGGGAEGGAGAGQVDAKDPRVGE